MAEIDEREERVIEEMAKAMKEVYAKSSINQHASMQFCREQARVHYRAYVAMQTALREVGGMSADQVQNTDIELWRGHDEGSGDYYSDSVHVTEAGGIGINAGGCVAVRTPKLWHDEIRRREQAEEELECVHMHLDDLGAPRMRDDERLSLVGRINWISKGRID